MDKFAIGLEASYHSKRAAQERRFAKAATNRPARRVHLALEKLHKMMQLDLTVSDQIEDQSSENASPG